MKYSYLIKILSREGSLFSLPFRSSRTVAEKAFYALSAALVLSDVSRLQLYLNDVSEYRLLVNIEHPFRG